jgi:hypothetical protein
MPCSLLKVNWRFGGTWHLHLQGRRISTARNQHGSRWQWTTWRYIMEDRTLRNHCRENLKSHIRNSYRKLQDKSHVWNLGALIGLWTQLAQIIVVLWGIYISCHDWADLSLPVILSLYFLLSQNVLPHKRICEITTCNFAIFMWTGNNV